jgi:putative membrane protein
MEILLKLISTAGRLVRELEKGDRIVISIHNSNSFRIAVVAAVCGLAPVSVLSQSAPMDPNTAPNIPGAPVQPNSLPSSPAAQDSAGAPGLTGQMMRDKMFLRDVVEANLLEIQLGKLASQKAPSADIKALGEKMATDHTDINQQMGNLADSLGYMVPKKLSKEDQATYEKLNALPADQFETQYVTLVYGHHRKDLHDFREEVVTTNDQNIHETVMKVSAVIYSHTKEIEKIAKEKNIPLPPPPQRKQPAPAGE